MKIQTTHGRRRVVIAGGGTSGWMAAAMLSRVLRPADFSVTVIEPPGPRGIGVGESSLASLASLVKMLGADETEMMRRCEATYKLGIRFCDWYRQGHECWHPFGVCGARIDGRDLFPFWLNVRKLTGSECPYHEFSLQRAAMQHGKGPHSFSALSPVSQTRSYAFHFNAELLAGWLRELALSTGTSEVSGTVADVLRAESGDVDAVRTTAGDVVSGDLFLDCTGFQSVLMNAVMEQPFVDWNKYLLCDRAVAFRGSRVGTTPPYTKSTAMPSGWSWQIPLADHVGVGYVYSSQFVSDEDAWLQLKNTSGVPAGNEITPRFLKMKIGRQAQFWVRNVIAVGLSAAFLEPLESSGIHLSQTGIELLLRNFPAGRNLQPLQKTYNSVMARLCDEIRDFVQLHYTLSQRDDTPFWMSARKAEISPELKHRLELYDDTGLMDPLMSESVPESSYYHFLTGNHRFPRRVSPLTLTIPADQIQGVLAEITRQNERALADLASHDDLLAHIHRPVMARAS